MGFNSVKVNGTNESSCHPMILARICWSLSPGYYHSLLASHVARSLFSLTQLIWVTVAVPLQFLCSHKQPWSTFQSPLHWGIASSQDIYGYLSLEVHTSPKKSKCLKQRTESSSKFPYCLSSCWLSEKFQIITPLTKLPIHSKDVRLLRAGHTLITASLCRQFHFVGGWKVMRSITHWCATCRHRSARRQPPIMDQLPREGITSDSIFNKVGIDYASPLYVKQGSVRN